MKPGSHRSQIALSVVVFIVGGVVFGLIAYFGVGGSHHQGNLAIAIVGGAIAAIGNYVRYRMRRAGQDPIYNAGRRLRDLHDDQLGQGGAPLPPGEAPIVDEPTVKR